ncbi:hypothetical protein SDC9_204623 [bioreactor metagenome]|uniref:Uncharacterized protein n=1 Tax=bioreactor metagenome TaxID=1076179 RepID=A0A645J187_9ZZZZ
MGDRHRACPDRHDCQDSGHRACKPKGCHHGRAFGDTAHNAGSGGDGYCGGALCCLEDGRNEEREEDSDSRQTGCMFLHVDDKTSAGNDFSQYSTGSGDEQDRADNFQCFGGHVVEVFHFAALDKQ